MEKLVDMAKKGDKEAFSNLIILVQKDLYKIAKMRLEYEDDICEAVQNTIFKAYNSLKKLKNSKYFKTWIIRILINECNTIYRNNQKLNFEEYDDNILEFQSSMATIENKIDELDFNILIGNLNYNERIVSILFYLEDLSVKEISKILDEPENTIKTRLSRSRKKLKKILEVNSNE